MNPYKERDLGSEYQQGIFDMLRGAKDLWLQSGIGLINPNNPVYKKTPQPKNYDDIRGLLDDPDLEYLPSLDPGSFMRGMTKVFHGSPHLFKNWDFSKMGSGEGAQAYGHGGYFAGSKNVGEHYAENLGKYIDPHHTYKGQKFETFDPWNKAYADVKGLDRRINHIIRNLENDKNLTAKQFIDNEIKGFEKGIEFLKKNPEEYKDLPEDMSIKGFQNIIDEYKSLDPNDFKFVPQGKQSHLYEIELKPDPEDFLDWSQSLSNQSPSIKNKLSKFFNKYNKIYFKDLYDDWQNYLDDLPEEAQTIAIKFVGDEIPITDGKAWTRMGELAPDADHNMIHNYRDYAFGFGGHGISKMTGEDFFRKLEDVMGTHTATDILSSEGFPGHRFLDGMSRSGKRPEKNYNYVVYPTDEADMIKITNPPKSLLD